MKRLIKRIALLTIGLWTLLPASASTIADDWALLPTPQQIQAQGGAKVNGSDFSYIIANDCEMPILFGNLDRLPRSKRKGIGISLSIDTLSTPQSSEGYILTINGKGADIKSRSQAGLMYGCITLDQLITQSQETSKAIPPMVITDYPEIDFRAVHFDTKHHLDRMDAYYTLIDRLAQWKINAVIWEVEDKLQYERRPECSAPNAISKQEMLALSRYAKDRNIDINPLVQGLGHAGFILKHHWELRENPKSDWEFCPSDPRYYDLQFDLYKDALEAMPYGKYLHIGGDEISAIGIDERCKATGKTPFELQMMWLGRICDWAKAHDRIPIFWDDMPFKYADLWWVLHGGLSDQEVERYWSTTKLDKAIDLFPKDCVYMRWLYDDPDYLAHRKIMDWYAHKDLKVMGATAASDGGSPFMPRHGSKTTHIRNFCNMAVEYGLEGIFATAWDDGSPHTETFTRGYAALGEWSWNPSVRSEEDFKKAHAQREYGLGPSETDFIEDLEASAKFFDTALIVEGRRNPAWQVVDFKLMDLPDPKQPGEWCKKYAAKLDSVRMEEVRYPLTQSKIKHAQENALRNRYTLEIYEQNNQLFHYPVTLLAALEKYDLSTDRAQRHEAIKDIQNVIAQFKDMRQNLESVYSRTRFMENPAGYIADMNHHHHLAALTPDSSWMYLYELAMINALNQWFETQTK
ncbi:MAG: beta-N-acetylhexosaminidase [Bacteroidales bacterium]|nr:beta-N-acetylhexosaminidase [Bacteroidales bacterium]